MRQKEENYNGPNILKINQKNELDIKKLQTKNKFNTTK